ncbi:MAG: hypothetical protein IPP47_14915 [Bryobacterales bacterium]|nr:hypothetical protein [Bryobacterales bacterium]
MASLLINTTSQGICAHRGSAKPVAPLPRVLLSGAPAVPQQPPWPVIGCTVPLLFGSGPTGQQHPIIGILPCFLVTWVTATTRVKSMGQPLLLADSQGIAQPNGLPVVLLPGQFRVTAI